MEENEVISVENIDNLEETRQEVAFEASRPNLQTNQSEIKNEENNTLQEIEKEKEKLKEINMKIEDINNTIINNNQSTMMMNSSSVVTLDRKNKKLIKELQKNQSKLKNVLNQLNQTEQVLSEEGYLNLSNNNASHIDIDRNIRKEKIKEIKKSKEVLRLKIEEITTQINKVIESNKKDNKAEIIKNFLDNFEHDKLLAEEKAKKFKKEKRKRNDRYLASMKEDYEKRVKTLESIEKEKEAKKQLELKIFHEQQKSIVAKRNEANKKEAEKNIQLLNSSPVKKYISIAEKNEIEFKEKQNEIIQQEKLKRKEKMRPIRFEEINEFSKLAKSNRDMTMVELEQKKIKMKELWKERKELLPKYHSSYLNSITEEKKKEEEEKERKYIDIKINKNLQSKISDEIKKRFVPKIDPKLQKELQERIKLLNSPPKISKSSHSRHGRIILKKINDTNKYSWKLKLKNQNNESNQTNPNKPKIDIRKPLEKPIDYLIEERKKRSASKESESIDDKQWDKLLNAKNGSKLSNIETVKLRAEYLQQQADMKKQLMKVQGKATSPELSEEIGKLYINSIEAKLKILNAISE